MSNKKLPSICEPEDKLIEAEMLISLVRGGKNEDELRHWVASSLASENNIGRTAAWSDVIFWLVEMLNCKITKPSYLPGISAILTRTMVIYENLCADVTKVAL